MTDTSRGWFSGLRGIASVWPTAEETAQQLANDLLKHLGARMADAKMVHLALSGGSTPRLLYGMLASRENLSLLDWTRIHLWMVDERCVPVDDGRRNYAMIQDTLISHVPIPPKNVHPMPVLEEHGAEQYERSLRAAWAEQQRTTKDVSRNPHERTELQKAGCPLTGASLDACEDLWERPATPQTGPAVDSWARLEPRLDAVVLGMGTDGHTASLFPQTPALDERHRLISLNDGEKVSAPRPRMTMTYPLINQALLIAILVTGRNKLPALKGVAANPDDFHTHPVAGVVPAPGSSLRWYLDRAACP